MLIFRQQVGLFRALDSERKVFVGVKGASDSLAVIAVQITPEMVGKTVAVAAFPEFKTLTGPQREKQEDYQRAVQSRGAVYRLVRSVDEMLALVDDVQAGRW